MKLINASFGKHSGPSGSSSDSSLRFSVQIFVCFFIPFHFSFYSKIILFINKNKIKSFSFRLNLTRLQNRPLGDLIWPLWFCMFICKMLIWNIRVKSSNLKFSFFRTCLNRDVTRPTLWPGRKRKRVLSIKKRWEWF